MRVSPPSTDWHATPHPSPDGDRWPAPRFRAAAGYAVLQPLAKALPARCLEVRPRGNTVTHEDEMMKAASNQMDYEAVTSLYTHSLNLIKLAVGKA